MAATADILDVRSEFPVLEREGLVYLDSGATAQKPGVVIEAMDDFLRHHNASVHRGVYPLAVESTDRFEDARARAAAWLNAPARGTVFTKNATEAINLVAYTWGLDNVGAGDTIVVTEMEHHSNVVSWQLLAQRVGATLAYVPIDGEGRLQLDVLDELLAREPKLVAVAHASNVLGTINPVADIVARARAAGAATLIDGAQAVPALGVDVGAIDADFYVWTAHKAYGPTGLGILHGRPQQLAKPIAIEDIVSQDHGAAVITDEFLSQQKGLCQAIGRGLHDVGKGYAKCAAVSKQMLKPRRVLRRGDNQDLSYACQHENGQRVINHRLVVHWQQLLAGHHGQRVQPGAGAASQYDTFHDRSSYVLFCLIHDGKVTNGWIAKSERLSILLPDSGMSHLPLFYDIHYTLRLNFVQCCTPTKEELPCIHCKCLQ